MIKNRVVRAFFEKQNPLICAHCGFGSRETEIDVLMEENWYLRIFCVHHRNWVHGDDEEKNLMILCRQCHFREHQTGYPNCDEKPGWALHFEPDDQRTWEWDMKIIEWAMERENGRLYKLELKKSRPLT